ncbi:Zbp-1 [Aphelenchoides bicaudatus]|nr:Zbp-1 [Aphelenchoides bicaudatus]
MAYNMNQARTPSSQSFTHGHGDYLRRLSVYVPNACIGAVIGYKGHFVRNLQQYTKTNIQVEAEHYTHKILGACAALKEPIESGPKPIDSNAKNLDEFGSNVAKDVVESALTTAIGTLDINNTQNGRERAGNMRDIKSNRCVNIDGTDENILKALFWIFQRVAETESTYISAISLHVEFKILDRIVGQVIGKSGSNIQQLKRISNGCDCHVTSKKDGTDATVCLYGTFGPTLVVITRINELRKISDNGTRRVPYSNGPLRQSNSYYNNEGNRTALSMSNRS